MPELDLSGYRYTNAATNASHDHLLPPVLLMLDRLRLSNAGKCCLNLAVGMAVWR